MEQIADRNLGKSSEAAQGIVDKLNKEEAARKEAERQAEEKRIAEEKAKAEAARIEAERIAKEQAAAQEAARQAEAARLAQIEAQRQKPAQAAPKPAPAVASGSGCDWLAGQLRAHGVSEGDIPAAIGIATRESGCRQSAVNSSSGACNVFQELPCGKWGGSGNLSAHIQGASKYARDRYGGWNGAYSAWQQKHWW